MNKSFEKLKIGFSKAGLLSSAFILIAFVLSFILMLTSLNEIMYTAIIEEGLNLAAIAVCFALTIMYNSRTSHGSNDHYILIMVIAVAVESIVMIIDDLICSGIITRIGSISFTTEAIIEESGVITEIIEGGAEIVYLYGLVMLLESLFSIDTKKGKIIHRMFFYIEAIPFVICLIILIILKDTRIATVCYTYLTVAELFMAVAFSVKAILTISDRREAFTICALVTVPVIFSVMDLFIEGQYYYYNCFFQAIAVVVFYVNVQVGRVNSAEENLHLSSNIQKSLFRTDFDSVKNLDICGISEKSGLLGKLFYDFEAVDEKHIMVSLVSAIGDADKVSLYMMELASIYKSLVKSSIYPEEIMNRLNSQLCSQNMHRNKACAIIGYINLEKNTLTFIHAGNIKGTLVRKDGNTISLGKEESVELGVDNHNFYHSETVALYAGDAFILYPGSGMLIEEDKLLECVKSAESASDVCKDAGEIFQSLLNYTKDECELTMLCIKIPEVNAAAAEVTEKAPEKDERVIKYHIANDNGNITIFPEGELAMENANDFAADVLKELRDMKVIGDEAETVKSLTFDCERLNGISSGGLQAIENIVQTIRAKETKVINCNPEIKNIFKLTTFEI